MSPPDNSSITPSQDERGEALPVAILFLGVFMTILIGVHVVLVGMGRMAVQSAADAAVAAAQAAGPGPQECDGDATTTETARQCEGILAARIAIAGANSSIIETRPPAIAVETERGSVTALVFGGTISPVFGGLEFTGQACGPTRRRAGQRTHRHRRVAMLKRGPAGTWRNELGSGTAIGVAIIFPMLMLLIVCLQMLSEAARIEQGVQAAANRAARAASLCCYHTGGSDGAEEVAMASLSAAEASNAFNQVHCNNDFVGSSEVVFIDVNGDHVPNDPDASGNYRAVPPGGTVHVFVTCRIPPQILGGYGIPGLDADRTAEGVATVDPYRYRLGA